jgi:dihydroorotase-like cyclic amidohydrolase
MVNRREMSFPHRCTHKGDIKGFRQRYKKVFVEALMSYLTLTSDSDLGVVGKTSPPPLYKKALQSLWEGVREGTIDTIDSDHVPRK